MYIFPLFVPQIKSVAMDLEELEEEARAEVDPDAEIGPSKSKARRRTAKIGPSKSKARRRTAEIGPSKSKARRRTAEIGPSKSNARRRTAEIGPSKSKARRRTSTTYYSDLNSNQEQLTASTQRMEELHKELMESSRPSRKANSACYLKGEILNMTDIQFIHATKS